MATPFGHWGLAYGPLLMQLLPHIGFHGRIACQLYVWRRQKQPLDWSLCSNPLRQQLLRLRKHATLRHAFVSRDARLLTGAPCRAHRLGLTSEGLETSCVQRATLASDKRALALRLSRLDAASRTSQAGPHPAQAFKIFPTPLQS